MRQLATEMLNTTHKWKTEKEFMATFMGTILALNQPISDRKKKQMLDLNRRFISALRGFYGLA